MIDFILTIAFAVATYRLGCWMIDRQAAQHAAEMAQHDTETAASVARTAAVRRSMIR